MLCKGTVGLAETLGAGMECIPQSTVIY